MSKKLDFKIELTFFVLLKGVKKMRSGWKPKGELEHLLSALMPENRLALELSLITGLRINDVLSLKPEQVKKQRFTIREEKTGKTKKVYIPKEYVERCIATAGQHYVFEHRLNGNEHRTRQAVFKDLKRVCRLFRIKENISPHTMRKAYAVEEFKRNGDLKKVQKLLNHTNEAVTMVYAFADILEKRKHFKNTKSRKI